MGIFFFLFLLPSFLSFYLIGECLGSDDMNWYFGAWINQVNADQEGVARR